MGDLREAESILAFDSNCGPCSRFKAVIEFVDVRRKIQFVSLEEADRSGLLEGIGISRRYSSFHLLRRTAARKADLRSGSEALAPLALLLWPSGAAFWRLLESTRKGRGTLALVYNVVSRFHYSCPLESNLGGAAGVN